MNRIVFALIIVGAVSSPLREVRAQVEISYGLKAGITSAIVSDVDFTNHRRGFTAGAFARFDFPVFVSFQAELVYAQKGYLLQFDQFIDLNGDVLFGNVDARFQIDYLELPVLLNFPLPILERLEPVLFFGPAVSFLVNDSVSFTNTSEEDRQRLLPEELVYDNVDISLAFGGRVYRPIGRRTIGLELRYVFGLTDITGGGVASNNIQNQVLSLMLQYGF